MLQMHVTCSVRISRAVDCSASPMRWQLSQSVMVLSGCWHVVPLLLSYSCGLTLRRLPLLCCCCSCRCWCWLLLLLLLLMLLLMLPLMLLLLFVGGFGAVVPVDVVAAALLLLLLHTIVQYSTL